MAFDYDIDVRMMMSEQNLIHAKKLSAITRKDAEDSLRHAEESQEIKEQGVQESIWRMQEANQMAKIKGMSKLAEAANQL